MSQIPVVFLAFANDQSNPLPSLLREDGGIYQHLEPGASEQRYLIHRDSYATLESIASFLTQFKDRVELFHYGGHAESDKIILGVEGTGGAGGAHAEGVARMLAGQKNLKLVFLNGCSTAPQVHRLLELGVPAVIATSTAVGDDKATKFALQFYHALSRGSELEEAFQTAAAYLQSLDGSEATLYRSAEIAPAETADMPWGLYYKEPEVLKTKLSTKSHKEIIIRGASDRYNADLAPVNKQLTQVLFEALAPYSEEVEFLHFKAEKGSTIDERLVRRAIIDCLPAPVGEQIRKLFAADPDTLDTAVASISEARLRQLVKTYNTLIELLTFTMLAQLWDLKTARPDLVIPAECKQVLNGYLLIQPEALPFFDYIDIVRQVRRLFDDHGIPYFIEELNTLKQVFYEDEEFRSAHQFMEELKKEIYTAGNKISKEEVESFCIQAESHLGNIFKKLGFTAKYTFATIKGIDIINPRHRPATFRHYKVRLDTITAGYLDLEEVYPTYTDNNSVLLLKSTKDVEEYLSLSPFVIDENALRNEQKSKLYYFSHYDSEKDTYIYRFVHTDDDILEISDTLFPEIKEQMEMFKQMVIMTNSPNH